MTYPDHMTGAVDADGAFTVGGDWGQNYTEASIRSLWTVPKPTVGNALAVLRSSLLKLPIEALRGFEGLLDVGAGVWNTITGAVDAIMGAIRNIPVFLQVDKWDDWLVGTWNTLSRMVNQMIEIFTGLIITPINEAIQGVKDWFGNFHQNVVNTGIKVQQTIDNIVRAWKNDNTIEGSVDDLKVVFGEARAVKYGLITLADLANAPSNVPFWVSPNPFDEVSFPRSQLEAAAAFTATVGSMNNPIPVSTTNWNGTVVNQIRDHNHTVTLSPSVERPRYTIFAGNIAFSAVRMTANRIVNSARFIAGGDEPPTAVYAALYEIDPATGNQTKVYDFGNIRSEIPTGPLLYEVALETEGDIIASAGTIMALALLPIGGSFTVAGISRSQIVPTVLIYPQSATALLTGQTAMPATVLQSALNHTAAFRAWAAIGQVVPETVIPILMVTSFDAYNGTDDWQSPAFVYKKSWGNARLRIVNGELQGSGVGQFPPADFKVTATALQACSTNDMFAEMTLGQLGWSTAWSSALNSLRVRMNQAGDTGVVAGISQQGNGNGAGQVFIYSLSAGVYTTRITVNNVGDFLPADAIRLEAMGNTYTVLKNGVPIPGAVWVDSTNIVEIGASRRRVGFESNAASWEFTVYRPASIDVWSGGDINVPTEDP